AAVHLGAHHAVAAIDGLLDRSLERRDEAGPSGAALELAAGHEQPLPAAGTRERADPLLIQQRTRSGPLGAVSSQHRVLLRGELRTPFGVGLFHGKGLVGHRWSRFIIPILGVLFPLRGFVAAVLLTATAAAADASG